MANFGKYMVVDGFTHTLKLEPELWWKFKTPTTKDDINVNQFLAEGRVIGEGEARRYLTRTVGEVARRELALTFGGTNIPGKKDKPILEAGASLEEIEAVIDQMPAELITELWAALGEHFPFWGPAKPAQSAGPDQS